MRKVYFQGIECVEISNDFISLLATISIGPRILSLKTPTGDNLFAILPEATLDCPGAGLFHLYGGHRLWHAPEDPAITYLPDDSSVEVEASERGIRLTQAIETKTSLQKILDVQIASDRASVKVKHTLTNHGDKEVTLAPWAITQLRPGGVAIIPQFSGWTENNPTLPNRSIALWPYTDINGEAISWGNEFILVHARMKDGQLKIGIPNPKGWLAYWIGGTLFVKYATYVEDAEYFDRGSSSECYCDPDFLELETLAPISHLRPGSNVEHVETWYIHENIGWSDDLGDILSAIEKDRSP
jgi:hypothetical protein